VVASELVGTLELASLGKQAFNESDLEVLRVLSGQAAVALHNAIQFQEEQRRILELSGLAKLAQAAGLVRETQDFFARLIEGIEPLLDVQTIGFLTVNLGASWARPHSRHRPICWLYRFLFRRRPEDVLSQSIDRASREEETRSPWFSAWRGRIQNFLVPLTSVGESWDICGG
jgi:hypothetical protein